MFGASWATKIPALMGCIVLIVGQMWLLFDNVEATVPDWTLIGSQVMIAVALFQARANLVSTEQAKSAAKQSFPKL